MSVTPIAERISRRAAAPAAPIPAQPRVDVRRALDLAAVAVFALGGGTIAADAGFGVVGILFAAFSTALVGGIIRDLLLGDTPPATLRTVVHPLTALGAGGLVCLVPGIVRMIPTPLFNIVDAAALALFCVFGGIKALDHGANVIIATLLGGISAFGGGIVRDVILGHVPAALSGDICVVAALVGPAVAIACTQLGRSRTAAIAFGLASCFLLRLFAAWEHWSLPVPHFGHVG
jgi:uncharacterized membrane protein YeiH